MSSLERILKTYEQAGSILPSQYQCRPTLRSEAIPFAIIRGPGGARRSRTDDILLAKQALYQLSYGPIPTGTVRSPGELSVRVMLLVQQSW